MCTPGVPRGVRTATSADATPPARAVPDPAVSGGPATGGGRDTQAEPASASPGLPRKNHGSRQPRQPAEMPGSCARPRKTTPSCHVCPPPRDTRFAVARTSRAVSAKCGVPCPVRPTGCRGGGPHDTGSAVGRSGASASATVWITQGGARERDGRLEGQWSGRFDPPVLPAFLVHRQMPALAAEKRPVGGGMRRTSALHPQVRRQVMA